MKLSTEILEKRIQEIEKLINDELFNEAYQLYAKVDVEISMRKYEISEIDKQDRLIAAEFYASFAYFLFDFKEYQQFFEMYIKAQNYGYSVDKRRKFIFEAFINSNIDDFKINYQTNIKQLKKNGSINKLVDFEKLQYFLIITGNVNEYYLYEKESNLIKERFVLNFTGFNDYNKEENIYDSDCLFVDDGKWNKMHPCFNKVIQSGKKAYIITSSPEKILSYFQGEILSDLFLSRIIIVDSIAELKNYLMSSKSYLPRQYFGPDKSRVECEEMIREVHDYRLNEKNRSGDRVILSICIPSFNRGNRAYDNVVHTLSSDLDEEIEVIVSNNGTQNETKSFYKKISEIKDPRVTYFEFAENQGVALNICKVVELAKGRYVLLLSDEDLVDLNKLNTIVSEIRNLNQNEVAIIRTKTDGQGIIPFIGMAKSGKDSLEKFMLTSNYLSGNIYNRHLIEENELNKMIKTNVHNEVCLYYPHMVWELILCQYGSVWGLDIVLINEGKAEKSEVVLEEVKAKKREITYYATIEGRINQHRGFFEIIKEMEICKNDFDFFRLMYKKLCLKTLFLVDFSNRNIYFKMGYKFDQLIAMLEKAYNESIELLDEVYCGKKSGNKYKFNDDMVEIKKFYLFFRNNQYK